MNKAIAILQKIPKKWQIFMGVVVPHIMAILDLNLIAPLIPEITQTLEIAPSQGGLWVTAYTLMLAISALVLSPFLDRWERRKTILIGTGIIAINTFLCGFVQDFWSLILLRGFAGIAFALIVPCVIAILSDLFQYKQRATVLGIDFALASLLSVTIWIPICTYIAQYSSWRTTFFFVSLSSVLASLWAAFLLPKTSPNRVDPPSKTNHLTLIKTVFSEKICFLSLILTFLHQFGNVGYFPYFGVYYSTNFNFNVSQIGLISILTGLGYMLGALIGGRIADKLGKKKVARFVYIFSSIGAIAFSLLGQNVILATIVIFFAWANFGMGSATIFSLVSEINPALRGTILSINITFGFTGSTLGTAASSGLIEHGFFYVGLMCATGSAMGLLVLRLLAKESRKKALAASIVNG